MSPASAPPNGLRLIAWVAAGLALATAGTLVISERSRAVTARTVVQSAAPDKSRVALARETRCSADYCQELQLGASASSATSLDAIGAHACSEIVWTPDSTRVGFVIDGSEVWLYDVQKRTLAGRIRLLTTEAAQSRLARGVTFSENGRALTFDDCPRAHSGCRAAVVGVPQ